MEEKRKKKSLFSASVVLSLAVAFFAVFSLIAYGFNKVSYAAPVTSDKFVFNKWQSPTGTSWFVVGKDNSGILENMFRVPLYFSDAEYKNPIFCIEHMASVDDKVDYEKGNKIEDYGLLYLLNNSYVNEKAIIPNSNKYVEAWATQVAIWVYLYETHPENPQNNITAEQMAAIKGATIFSNDSDLADEDTIDFGYSIFDRHIRPLIETAKKATDLKQMSVSKADGEIVKTSDGKFYQTPVISAIGSPSSDLINYDVTLSGVDGAFLVDEDGKDLALTNIAAGRKFYVRIPVDKVTTEVQNLKIGVTGHFNSLTGHEYNAVGGGLQKVVSVTGTTTDVASGLSLEIVGAPDTGMNAAQTVYFIGLVVLLCGIGIIYANAKPVDAKQ